MPAIKSLRAKEILDSRGNPTVHVTLTLDSGEVVETSIPNGIKQYPQEAFNLRDQDPQHMEGKGVQKVVALINKTLNEQLAGKDPIQQEEIDQLLIQLDGTEQKTQAGANTLIAISQAVAKAGAAVSGLPLYQYLFNQSKLTDHLEIPTCLYGLVNGGQYGSDNLDIQEFLIIPASHADYRVSLEIESGLRSQLQRVLKSHQADYSTGALGGFTPALQRNADVFEFIVEAARKTSYILSRDFFFGIDAGADNLLDKSGYTLKDKQTAYREKDLAEYYKNLQDQYSLTYFEDPFAAKDTDSWKNFTIDLGQTTRIASDILTATNPKLVQQAIQNQYANTLIVKPSQIGTLTETLKAVRIAREAGWSIVVSQRTGETNDDFLADFAVGIGAEFVKFGPTNRGEAVAKYNRLADIYLELEKIIREGATMTQTDQPANQQATQPDDQSNQDAGQAPAAPAAPAQQPAQPTPVADNSGQLPRPSEAPQAPQAPVADPAGGQGTPSPTPIDTPVAVGGDNGQAAAPTNPAPAEPASQPAAAPANQEASQQSDQPAQPAQPAATNPSEPPVNTPPAAAPIAPVGDLPAPPAAPANQPAENSGEGQAPAATGNQPLESNAQEAINSTLQEIGAAPQAGGQAAKPADSDQQSS